VADVPSGLSLTPPRETKKKKLKVVSAGGTDYELNDFTLLFLYLIRLGFSAGSGLSQTFKSLTIARSV
jgi:hypothetical protein